jgi:hypothetical protein
MTLFSLFRQILGATAGIDYVDFLLYPDQCLLTGSLRFYYGRSVYFNQACVSSAITTAGIIAVQL